MVELLHPGVYVQEVPPVVRPIEGASTSTTAFVGVADKGPIPGTRLGNGAVAYPPLVTSFTEYLRTFGGFRRDSFLTYAVQAYFNNGGRRLYVVRVSTRDANGQLTATPAATPTTFPLTIEASSPGAWGDKLWVEIVASSDDNPAHPTNFKLNVYYDPQLVDPTATPAVIKTGPGGRPLSGPVESFDQLTFDDPNNPNLSTTGAHPAEAAQQVVNSRSEFIAMKVKLAAALPAGAIPTAPTQLSGGNDSGTPGSLDFLGMPPGQPQGADPALSGSGLHALDKIDDVSLIAIPGMGDVATISGAMEYCKLSRPLSDCFFIGDVGVLATTADPRMSGTAPDIDTPQQAHGFPAGPLDRSVGDYGAIYYPWVWAADPIGRGNNPRILLPPSGFVAGLYARIDNTRGVFKAPAGTEAGLAGVLAPARVIDDIEQDSLNPVSVNVIRPVPAGGIVVWGARTIGSDPGWRYIPVRRMAIFLRVSIYRGIQWAVFEPNDEPLWSSLRLNIRAFMLTQFRAGAFQGAKPDDAFFVLCDSTTTTQTDIDNGVVNILVGFAPLKPAEFVVLKLSQKVNQPASQ